MWKFLKRSYQPLNIVEINKSNLLHNYNYLSSINKKIEIAPCLKSNAYGHGISVIGKIVDEFTPPFICVDSLYEAYELSKAKIKSHILIMGYVSLISLQTKKLPYSFTVFNKKTVDALNKYQSHAPIHVFVDTGMHREGVSIKELPALLQYIQTNTKLEIEGLMSHFAMSDKHNDKLTKQQVEAFQIAQKIVKDMGINPKWVHIANSCGILNHKNYKGELGNVARVGKAFYGYDPEGLDTKLKPALELKTYIAQIKKLKKGDRVGYDFTYTVPKDTTIAVLPIGYNDGVERNLSNVGIVTIKGQECSIIGRVSMNITVIEINNLGDISIGDEVTVYSNNPKMKNSVDNASNLANKITHEMLVHINQSTRRIILT
jgi:alanine racemase